MNEQLISKIRTIADSEKFKRDAFFLCGSNTGAPNQKLLDACEAYLRTAEDGRPNEAEAKALIAELEAAVSAGQQTLGSNKVANNADYMREILSEKDALINV